MQARHGFTEADYFSMSRLPNKVGPANAGWPSQLRFRGLRHRPGMADLTRSLTA
jgi:hypothetical protein